MKKILTIAGSDSSGGAGIQADLRTFAKHDLYGLSSLTVIVTMDPASNWVHNVFPIDISIIKAQIDTALTGVGVDTIKLGMLPTPEIIRLVTGYLEKWVQKVPIVVDPVMVCKGDKPLFPEHAQTIKEALMPFATIATPNLFEAAQLADMPTLTSLEEAEQAASKILVSGCKNVVIKGVGKLMSPSTAADMFYDGREITLIPGELIDTMHTHGVGCTFAAHVAACLCKGSSSKEAAVLAKTAVQKGLKHHFALNKYVGTLGFTYSFE